MSHMHREYGEASVSLCKVVEVFKQTFMRASSNELLTTKCCKVAQRHALLLPHTHRLILQAVMQMLLTQFSASHLTSRHRCTSFTDSRQRCSIIPCQSHVTTCFWSCHDSVKLIFPRNEQPRKRLLLCHDAGTEAALPITHAVSNTETSPSIESSPSLDRASMPSSQSAKRHKPGSLNHVEEALPEEGHRQVEHRWLERGPHSMARWHAQVVQ